MISVKCDIVVVETRYRFSVSILIENEAQVWKIKWREQMQQGKTKWWNVEQGIPIILSMEGLNYGIKKKYI